MLTGINPIQEIWAGVLSGSSGIVTASFSQTGIAVLEAHTFNNVKNIGNSGSTSGAHSTTGSVSISKGSGSWALACLGLANTPATYIHNGQLITDDFNQYIFGALQYNTSSGINSGSWQNTDWNFLSIELVPK